MPSTAAHPILLLADIARRSKAHAAELPLQIEVKPSWDGVGFSLGGRSLVASVDEVKEILTLPRITPVPGAKSWIRGVANVRGTLLPVMDLQGFLLGQASVPGRRSRILVVRHKGISAGLVVDEVLGLRHFFEEEFSEVQGEDAGGGLAAYLRGTYRQEGETWPVFSLNALVESQEFTQVAA